MDQSIPRRMVLVVASVIALTLSGLAAAEPPSRAGRLGYISGTVSFSPAGESDWFRAVVNRPLTSGDRLWVDADSRAEVQIGGAAVRLGPSTNVTLVNLNNRIAQVRLSQGSLKVRVRRMGPNQTFEVATPNLALSFRRPGEYRIDVDPADDATSVIVQSGQAEVYGQGASYAVNSRQSYRFYGTGLSDYERLAGRRDDALDRWARERDRRGENSKSARYVSSEVVGYEDLDTNGTWRADPNYGNVWTPTRVAAGWTPYRNGHWSWVDPWGWTWIDDAPWGFAVSHYGRWANIGGSWSWVPGPRREQAVYSPALVAFVGDKNYQGSQPAGGTAAANIGWFPLAPREIYQPSYPVSRGYFDNINRSNAVIAPAAITNAYNSTTVTTVVNNSTVVNNTTNVTRVVYVNQQVAGAVVAVPARAFAQSQPVANLAVNITKEAALGAPVVHIAAVAPVQQSVHGGAASADAKPPRLEKTVVALTAPPPPPISFAAQQAQLALKPGAPIDEARRTQLKPAIPAEAAPKVSVVASVQAPLPTAVPPATPPAAKSSEARKAEAAKTDVAAGDPVKAEAARAEVLKADAVKAAAAKAEAAKADAAKADAAKTEAAKADAAKADAVKAAAAKAEAAKADAAKADAAKTEAVKADAVKAAAAKTEAAKAEVLKADAAKVAAVKAEAAKAEAARADAVKAEAVKADAAKADAAKVAAVKAEAAKAEAAKAAAAKAEVAKVEVARADAAKAEIAKANAAKAEAAKAAASKSEAGKGSAAKAEVANAEVEKGARARAPSVAASAMAQTAAPKSESDVKAVEEKKK